MKTSFKMRFNFRPFLSISFVSRGIESDDQNWNISIWCCHVRFLQSAIRKITNNLVKIYRACGTFDVTITNSESFLVTKDHASRAVNDLCQEIGGCHVDCLNETVTIESLSYAFKCFV